MDGYTSPYDERPMREQTVGSVLENRAEHREDDPYMFYGPEDRAVSFAETNRTANAIATSLGERGVGLGDTVALQLRHPLQTMFAMFGINKAGAVYSPVNYDYEGDLLAYQLDDVDPDFLIVEDRYAGRLNAIAADLETDPPVAVYETDAGGEPLADAFEAVSYDAFLKAETTPPDVDVAWHDPASVVYTSGTTGRPKGVVIPHRWIFGNYVYPSRPSEDAVSHCPLPLYHVGGLYAAAVSALASGSAVALWDRFSPTEFWDRVDRYDVTSVVLISVMMTWLMDQPEREDDRHNPVQYASMNPLPDDYDEIARRFGFDFVTAGFGQTESGNPTSGLIHAARGEDATPEAIRKIDPREVIEEARERGTPVVEAAPDSRWMGQPNDEYVEVTVLDDTDEECPPGEVGELAIRPNYPGILLAEYYGKPAATVEAWRNLWFHTGDAVYRDAEDNYFFVDRMGDVIRRRGENVSSMQVQDAATTHGDVAGAAAFPVPAAEGGEDEVGLAVELREGARVTEEAVTDHLADRLPAFMVPTFVRIVEEIPTTETNKMEKYRLREELLEGQGR